MFGKIGERLEGRHHQQGVMETQAVQLKFSRVNLRLKRSKKSPPISYPQKMSILTLLSFLSHRVEMFVGGDENSLVKGEGEGRTVQICFDDWHHN